MSNAFVRGRASGTTSFIRSQVSRLGRAVTNCFAGRVSGSDLRTDVAALVAQGSVAQGKKQEAVSAQVVDAGVPYPGNDVALLKIEADGLKPLPLGESDLLPVGSRVYALGAPRGLEGSLSEGLVSAVRRGPEVGLEFAGTDIIQFTAPISPGSSGGPLLNGYGQVVGLVDRRVHRDRHPGAVVLEQLLQFGRGVQRVVLDHDRTQAQDRVEGDQVLGTVGEHDGHSVAGTHAPFAQLRCSVHAGLLQLGEGVGVVRIGQRTLVGLARDPGVQQGMEPCLLYTSPSPRDS